MGNCIQQQWVCLCLEMNTILCGIFLSISQIIERKWILQFVGLTGYNLVLGSGLANCLINIGERAGSGVPNVFNTWADQGWPEPIIEEEFDPDRTILILTIKKKRRTKTGSKKQAIKPFNI